ncbi:MAG: aromatic amino acid transport family protein [Patescibacteria group bacterium]|jgi:amino acid permease|nr:aromatic amino acid transport family protein [Patescibacteria group bacterium]
MKKINFYKAVAVLIGTVIGSGTFGLPFVISRVGFLPGLFYILFLASTVLIINYCYTEVILRTKETCQMTGYARKYLGKWGERLIATSLILGIYGALISYTMLTGEFLSAILAPYLGGSSFIYGIIFWFLGSLAICGGLKTVASLELTMTGLLIFVMFYISGVSLPQIDINNFSYINLSYWFLPYGIILFAMGGATAIPTMKDILKEKTILLRKAVNWGFVIPLILYLIFIIGVLGATGFNTSEEALIGLSKVLGKKVLLIGGIFGILATSTSFLALGHVLKDMYRRDYKFSYLTACLATLIIPLLIYLTKIVSFVQLLGITGTILSGFEGILLIKMYYQSKKLGDRQPEFSFNLNKIWAWGIYLIFSLGVIYEIIYFIF